MVSEGLEPGAEAARRVVGESTQLLGELHQDVLGHVLGVGVLELPLPAPAVEVPPVTLDEHVPGCLVRRVLPQPRQQGDARRWHRRIRHRYYSRRGQNLALITRGRLRIVTEESRAGPRGGSATKEKSAPGARSGQQAP